MERRVLFAILLSFVVLYGYQALVVKPKPAESVASSGSAPAGQAPPAPATAGVTQPPPASNQSSSATPARDAAPVVSEQAERDVRIETTNVVAIFTNRGARLKSWRLKHYRDGNRQPQELVVPL